MRAMKRFVTSFIGVSSSLGDAEMKDGDAIRYNWDKILELSPRISEEEAFRKTVFFYNDIISRTPYEWERKRAQESLEWLLRQRQNRKVISEKIVAVQKNQDLESTKAVEDYRIYKADLKNVTYNDIGGLEHPISLLREIVELPIKHPEVFQRLGIEPTRGVLLHGPPGCGKTLLAKAVANESQASFFSIAGPEIMGKFYGESEERLRQIFQQAQKNTPAIIFFDELDALAPHRQKVSGDLEKRVVSQLLTLMDGLKERGKVIVIGATNTIDLVDPALRRPGRFDRKIEIGLPDLEGRLEVLRVHSKFMPLSEDVDLRAIAVDTKGFSGAELGAVCKEAGYQCLRRHKEHTNNGERVPDFILNQMEVTGDDFRTAIERIQRGVHTEPNNGVRVSWDRAMHTHMKQQTENEEGN